MNEIYNGMSYADYEKLPGERVSDLIHMRPTPAHFQAHRAAPRVSKPEFVIGHALHTLVLEPHLFDETYFVMPDGAPKRPTERQVRVGSKSPPVQAAIDAAVEFWASIEAGEHRGKEILTADDYAMCRGMADSIAASASCQRYLGGDGYNEVVATWTDPDTGVVCKQRNDSLRSVNGRLALLDVKTAENAEKGAFAAASSRFGYFTKAGFYRRGMTVVGHRPDLYVLIVVEKSRPWCAVPYPLSAAALAQGEGDARDILASYAACESAGVWPGYEEEELDHPRWSRRKDFYQW